MKAILYILIWILLTILVTIHLLDRNELRRDREFSRKLFETAYKAGQANEAYKVYMFRVNHVHFSADSMYKVDSLKIDSMICEHF